MCYKNSVRSLKWTLLPLFLLLTGCLSYTISPQVPPPSGAFNPTVGKSVALVISPELKNYRHSGSPSSLAGGLQSYEFNLGEPIVRGLTEQLQSTFQKVDSFEFVPNNVTDYDAIIQPQVTGFEFAVNDSGAVSNAFWFGPLGAANTTYSSDVMIEISANVRYPRRNSVQYFSARGFGRKGAGALAWKGSDFNQSASSAITSCVKRLTHDFAISLAHP